MIPGGTPDARRAPDHETLWCASCQDRTVQTALSDALTACGRAPHDTVIVTGSGCAGQFPHNLSVYGIQGVHGRVLPTALGVKLANPDLTVIAVTSGPFGFSAESGFLPYLARQNVDLVSLYLEDPPPDVFATATPPEFTGSSPAVAAPVNPLRDLGADLSLGCGADVSFVARGYSGQPEELRRLFTTAIQHVGTAVVQVLAPCRFLRSPSELEAISARCAPLPVADPTDDLGTAIARVTSRSPFWLGRFRCQERPALDRQLASGSERLATDPDLTAVWRRIRNVNRT
ncbi:MAG: thiamine pyrophosphate-dependent enzyme [bacterium]